jgi:hypothetical protein
MTHHEQSARAKATIDTSDARAHLEAAAALGFVVAAMGNRRHATMPTILQLLALLPLSPRAAQDAFVLIGQSGSEAKTHIEAKLRSELGAAVSFAFSVGYGSHLAWRVTAAEAEAA